MCFAVNLMHDLCCRLDFLTWATLGPAHIGSASRSPSTSAIGEMTL